MNECKYIEVMVANITAEAKDVVVLDLKDIKGDNLPDFTAGSHIDVYLPNRQIRQYSLCNSPSDKNVYRIAIGLARESRGGSEYIHKSVKKGERLKISYPRNNFELISDAYEYYFIAGGIGITPIMSMIMDCVSSGRKWHLCYCTRNRQRTAFYEQLESLENNNVAFHFDDEAGSFVDLDSLLKNVDSRAHIYCCGPSPLMNEVKEKTHNRPGENIHFEWFVNENLSTGDEDNEFTIIIKSTGKKIKVPPGYTILEVLEQNGIEIPYSCREGLCSTCCTRVLSGIPDHRDSVLSNEERNSNEHIIVCVSRSLSDKLELDL